MRVGFIGAGGIAREMALTMRKLESPEYVITAMRQMHSPDDGEKEIAGCDVPKIECTAVAARDLERAELFARTYGFRRAYGNYEELLADPEIDLVYIALPHSHHCRWTKSALAAGKHVLCEKAFALNEAEAREMVELAQKKGLLLAEAIWTRYMPSRKIIDGIIGSGELGEVHTVSANIGYPVFMNERMFRPELGGGALLDLTVYPLNFAGMVLGDNISGISASCIMDSHGVDGQNQVMIAYADGKMASLFASMYTMTDRTGWVYGEKGFLEVQNINNPEAIRLYRRGERNIPFLEREYPVPPQINGYEYEVIACALAIRDGKYECGEMPHSETLNIMRQMDRIRKIWKIF